MYSICRSTGREHLSELPANRSLLNNKEQLDGKKGSEDSNVPIRVTDLSPLEVAKMALSVAERLQHPYMQKVIQQKIDTLESQKEASSSSSVITVWRL